MKVFKTYLLNFHNTTSDYNMKITESKVDIKRLTDII